MIGLFCFALAVLGAPFKSKLRLEAENAGLRHRCDQFTCHPGWTSPPQRPGLSFRYTQVAAARNTLDDTVRMRGQDPLTALKIEACAFEIAHYCDLGTRVIDQARRRLLDGEQVPPRFALFVAAAVLANNLIMIIGELLTKRSRRRHKTNRQFLDGRRRGETTAVLIVTPSTTAPRTGLPVAKMARERSQFHSHRSTVVPTKSA